MDARGRGGDFLRLSVPSSDAALKHLLIRECLPMNGRSEEQPRLLSRRPVLSPMNQHYKCYQPSVFTRLASRCRFVWFSIDTPRCALGAACRTQTTPTVFSMWR